MMNVGDSTQKLTGIVLWDKVNMTDTQPFELLTTQAEMSDLTLTYGS